jgi:transcriptional regulator with XRE-family HTH domain
MVQVCVMPKLGEVFRSARQSRGWSQDFLAQRSSVPKNTIQNLETGKSKTPNAGTILRLLRAFGFSTTDDLLTEHQTKQSRREMIESNTRSMGADPYRGDPALGIPVKNKTTAGPARDYQDVGTEHYDHIPITHAAIGDPDAFALQIVGTSMEPRWRDGDYALFAPRAQWDDGDECLVQFNENYKGGEGNTFKRVQNLPGGKLLLIPNNSKDHKTEVVAWASHIDDSGEVVRVVKCVGKYERYDWTPKPADASEGYRNQRQNDDDLPVIQRER